LLSRKTLERYQIRGVRRSGRLVVADNVAVDIRVFNPADGTMPVATIPLSAGAVRFDAPALPPRRDANAPPILDPELPFLLMARRDPRMLNDPAFVATAFAVRREIETNNHRFCNASPDGAGRCVPTSLNDVIPSDLI
jgi:hypothetical protein